MTTLGYTRDYVQEDYPDSMSFVPHSVRTEHTARAITAQRIVTSVRPLGGSSISAGGNLIFQLPYGEGAGFMKAGSAYIRAELLVQGSSTGTYGFAGSMGDASTLINQLNVTLGGASVENILYVNKFTSNVLNPWMTSASYLNNLALTSGLTAGQPNLKAITYTESQGANASVNKLPNTNFTNAVAQSSSTSPEAGNAYPKILIPLHFSGLLNGGDSIQSVPLSLLNSPLSLQFLMSSVNDALWTSSAFTPTNWTLNNIELIYEKLNPEPSYIHELKAQMASKLYVIPLTTVQSVTFQGGSNVSYNASINSSALKGAAFGYLPVSAQATSTTTSKAFQAPTGAYAGLDSTDGVFNRILLLDSEPADLFPDRCKDAVTKIAENYRMVSGQCFSDPDLSCNITQVGDTRYGVSNSFGTYYGSNTVTMFNTQPYTPEVGVVMNGKPVNIANFIAQFLNSGIGYSSNDAWYGYFFIQELLTIAGDGSATIVK